MFILMWQLHPQSYGKSKRGRAGIDCLTPGAAQHIQQGEGPAEQQEERQQRGRCWAAARQDGSGGKQTCYG